MNAAGRARYHSDPEKTLCRQRAQYRANPEEKLRKQRAQYRANPEKTLCRQRAYYYSDLEKSRRKGAEKSVRWRLRHPEYRQQPCRNYGITEERYQELLAGTKGICQICQRATEKFHIDHCHKTGKFRGLLCANCNWCLGQAKDNPQTLRSAAAYLEKHS